MSDYSELKSLAELATQGTWRYGPGDGDDENPVVFVDLPQASKVAISILFEADWATDADAKFVSKANPTVVRALIAENEELITALNEILRVTPMGVEAFGIAALVLGELGVSKEAQS